MNSLLIDNTVLETIAAELDGDFYHSDMMKVIYATDASVYRELPLAVAIPENNSDLKKLIHFANTYQAPLIPRGAGTSLAGQCVGDGIIVDISKHFTNIIAFDEHNKTVTVQPGVIRDELNLFLKPVNFSKAEEGRIIEFECSTSSLYPVKETGNALYTSMKISIFIIIIKSMSLMSYP